MANHHHHSSPDNGDGNDDSFQHYVHQYREMGFNQAASEHLANLPAWFPGSAKELFEDTANCRTHCDEYGDLYEGLLDLSAECTTRTEVYLIKALAEGYIKQDFLHTASQIATCKRVSASQNPQMVFFNAEAGLWWPSISEHWYAVDYTPRFESFTQLTSLFALAHADPCLTANQFEVLKRDPLLYDSTSGCWMQDKSIDPQYADKKLCFTSGDQLMSVLIQSLFDREKAQDALNAYKSSQLYRNGVPLFSIGHTYSDREPRNLDRLLLTTAEIFVTAPEGRRNKIEELRQASNRGFNSDTGRWYREPKRSWERSASDFMLERLLSVILNTLCYPVSESSEED